MTEGTITPCGPLCDGEHKISEPHNLMRDPRFAEAPTANLPVHRQELEAATEGSPAAAALPGDTFDGTTPSPRPCAQTASEVFMSLNGFDEIAIANHFGARVTDLREDPITFGRALAFVHQRRDGLTDKDAYAAAMALTIDTVSHAYFTPEPPKADAASAEGNAPSSTPPPTP